MEGKLNITWKTEKRSNRKYLSEPGKNHHAVWLEIWEYEEKSINISATTAC